MCGLAGQAATYALGRTGMPVLRAAGRYLAPRGPDDEVVVQREHIELVFRRLAINDVAGGRQPFVSDDGSVVVAVNGEIYNHRELAARYLDVPPRTRSDCEIVLHLYQRLGTGFLSLLNGIFAFAVWDENLQRLLLARDRLGVKPLYYAQVGGSIVFGSELKAVLAYPQVPRGLDWPALRHVPNAAFPFARPGAGPVPTGVQGVSFVEPATWLEWQAGRVRTHRYWHPQEPAGAEQQRDPDLWSADEMADRYAELLLDSVRMELMSDRPIGVFLSGGLDSSLLLAAAVRSRSDLEAFTLVEPSIGETGDVEAAAALCRYLGVPHHTVRVDDEALAASVSFDLATLEYFVWIMDFPLVDVEFLLKHELHRQMKAVTPETRVVMLGQGADEFAGGYSVLGFTGWHEWSGHSERLLHESLLDELGVPAVYRPFVARSRTESSMRAVTGGREPWQVLGAGDLAAYNLWHEDRTAAANGVEARVPYLDHRLVDLLGSVATSRHAELFHDKAIVRRAARRFLPDEFTRRAKVPLLPTGDMRSGRGAQLTRRLAVGAFDEFADRYLGSTWSLFARPELAELYGLATGSSMWERASYLLLRCMAIGVFERMCDELRSTSFMPPAQSRRAEPGDADVARPR